ncbi:MAG: hypothetical protein ACREBE_17880 [bacterium]
MFTRKWSHVIGFDWLGVQTTQTSNPVSAESTKSSSMDWISLLATIALLLQGQFPPLASAVSTTVNDELPLTAAMTTGSAALLATEMYVVAVPLAPV